MGKLFLENVSFSLFQVSFPSKILKYNYIKTTICYMYSRIDRNWLPRKKFYKASK